LGLYSWDRGLGKRKGWLREKRQAGDHAGIEFPLYPGENGAIARKVTPGTGLLARYRIGRVAGAARGKTKPTTPSADCQSLGERKRTPRTDCLLAPRYCSRPRRGTSHCRVW